MGWLNDVSVRRASLGTASETASPGTGRNSLDQPVAAKLPDPLAAGLTGNEGGGGVRCRAPHSARPVPLGDLRSSILRDPTARRLPKTRPQSLGNRV